MSKNLLVSLLLILVLAVGLFLYFVLGTEEGPDERPHVILILVDALRYDYVSAYGSNIVKTPHIDRFAETSTRFERAYAVQGMSAPSYTSLFTSLYPQQHGLLNNGESVPEGVWWLPGELQSAGYQTASFMSNVACGGTFGFDRGFDEFWEDRDSGIEAERINGALLDWLTTRDRERPAFLLLVYMETHNPFFTPELPPNLAVAFDGEEIGRGRADGFYTAQKYEFSVPPGVHDLTFHRLFPDRSSLIAGEEIEEGTLDITSISIRPDTLHFEYGAGWEPGAHPNPGFKSRSVPDTAHAVLTNTADDPVRATLEFRGIQICAPRQLKALYAECVAYFDRQFENLVQILRDDGLWENSLIVFLADHGQGLGDHGYLYHSDQLYDSILRIPLLVKMPGQSRGKVCPGPVSILDISKTVLTAVGMPAGEQPELQGYDLARIPEDRDLWPERSLFAATFPPEAPDRLSAMLHDGWKLIFNHDVMQYELYNLLDDPGEQNDLSGSTSKPEIREQLREWTEGAPERADVLPEKIDPETLEKLQAQGYFNR